MYVTFSNWENGLQLGKRAPTGQTGSNWENGQQYRAFLTRREYDR